MIGWLVKPRPQVVRVCTYCSGPYGLMRPKRGFCSTYCVAWAENEKYHPPTTTDDTHKKPPEEHDELTRLLQYP